MAAFPNPKPAAPGWVLFSTMTGAYWHWLQADWTTPCQPGRIRNAGHILEWRPEPRGRHEACVDCRKRLQRLAKLKDHPVNDEPEPEVLVPDPVLTPPELPVAASPPLKIIPHPQVRALEKHQSGGTPFIAATAFAEQHNLEQRDVLDFIREVMPSTPRLGDHAKAPYILDPGARERLLAELPAWAEARRTRKPVSQHEQVLAAIDEVKQMLLMLAEDVAKLRNPEPKEGA